MNRAELVKELSAVYDLIKKYNGDSYPSFKREAGYKRLIELGLVCPVYGRIMRDHEDGWYDEEAILFALKVLEKLKDE